MKRDAGRFTQPQSCSGIKRLFNWVSRLNENIFDEEYLRKLKVV
jgi:hypothetical protein